MRIDLGGLIFASALVSQITALSLTSLPGIPRTTGTPVGGEIRFYQGAGGVSLIAYSVAHFIGHRDRIR